MPFLAGHRAEETRSEKGSAGSMDFNFRGASNLGVNILCVLSTTETNRASPSVLPNVRAPGARNASLSLFKEIPLSRVQEGMKLESRLESYNALNYPQFAGPNGTVDSGSFGVISSQANRPREMQMALKLYW